MAKKSQNQKHDFPDTLFVAINEDDCLLASRDEADSYQDSKDALVAEYRLVSVRKLTPVPVVQRFDREVIAVGK